MAGKATIKEVIPTSGMLFQELKLYPVLCKPKLLPLKSVTLEKLERMQKEAQEKMWEMEKESLTEPSAGPTPMAALAEESEEAPSAADVWNADDDAAADEEDDGVI